MGSTQGPQVYGRKWTPPRTCTCEKVAYPTEARALAAAGANGAAYDAQFSVYKCPGNPCWHLATRGFHPSSLKTRPRIMAFHLTAHGTISQDRLFQEMGLDPPVDKRRGAGKQIDNVLWTFRRLGLIDEQPSHIRVTAYEGLRRIMAVGLQEYAAERRRSVTQHE